MSLALKLTIIFICVAAVLTFYSRTMYNASIPTVQISLVRADTLRVVHTGEGFIEPKETASLYAPGDLVVTEVLAGKYDTVNEGDVLVTFDVSGLENELKDLNFLRDKMITQLHIAWDPTLEMDIGDTERHIRNLREQIEQSRELIAPFEGMVTDVNAQPGMMAGRYAPLFELANTDLGFVVRNTIPIEYAKFFDKGNVYPVGSINKLSGTVISRTPAPDGGIEITIEIDPGRTKLKPDMLVEFELVHFTEVNPALVPLTAIFNEAYVFKLTEKEGPLGIEYWVTRMPVEVGLQADGWVAVTGNLMRDDKVVVSSDRPLSDERVKLDRGE